MKKTDIRERKLEEAIEMHLAKTNGFVGRSPLQFDRELCLDRELLFRFIKTTQPVAWERLIEQHGDEVEERFIKRLVQEWENYLSNGAGTVDLLRKGVTDHGVKFSLAFFKPETGFNEEAQAQYSGNIFSVTRQVKYSKKNENSIDTVLFLNGLPVFTVEIKNQLSGQSYRSAITQYKQDRDPVEPLLRWKRCLAHFAVDTDEVWLTTRLDRHKTRFLPFNLGNEGGAGNPVNQDGFRTEYLWKQVWTRNSLLEIIGRFIQLQAEEREDDRGRKIKSESLVFPRYHQLDAVRRLVTDARANGAGKNYLIQHSAGSGKSNTIAWTAHRLSELHDTTDRPVFDGVVIITDRRVLDKQLRDTVKQFELTSGVVKKVENGGRELKKALEDGAKIITTTLQKFPVIVDSIDRLSGKRFAVIIDEAHSSQGGEGVTALRRTLRDEALQLEEAEKQAKEEAKKNKDIEDRIIEEMESRRAKVANISFFAFTATPKAKTLETFGWRDPIDKQNKPFHLYSMKQAIEEGFILDVLKNYTTYKSYFALLKKISNDPEYDKKAAERLMITYVEKHEHTVNKKVEAIVRHFDETIVNQINGQSKAMIVTRSRLHAVYFKRALDTYLHEHNYRFKSLVAFSGKVKDGELEYTEAQMNGVPETNTAQEFKKPEYKFLVVAEKFQTGFDQPLLTAMYVDKKLSGVAAVQTLSRLNRTHAEKDEVFVLDFVNEADDIKESFQPYYTTTVLSETTDPNVLHDLERDLYAFRLFGLEEVEDFAKLYYGGANPATLNSALDKIVSRFKEHLPEEREEIRSKLADYNRKYAFISQIIRFTDTRLEKLYAFARLLLKKLPYDPIKLPQELVENIDIESYKLVKKSSGTIFLENEIGELSGIGAGHGGVGDNKEMAYLSAIIKEVNDRFGTEFSQEDKLILSRMGEELSNDADLRGAILSNTVDQAKIKFDAAFEDALVKALNSHFKLYEKLDKSRELKDFVGKRMFDFVKAAAKR